LNVERWVAGTKAFERLPWEAFAEAEISPMPTVLSEFGLEFGWQVELEVGWQVELEVGWQVELEVGWQVELEVGR
jgi:hypothetical protein